MTESIIISILLIGVGLFSTIASFTNWDYFFNHRKAKFFISLFGRTGTRIFYAILGIGLFVFGVLVISGIVNIDS